MSTRELTQDVYSKMQTESPDAVYKKAILGGVWVKVINPFSGEPEDVLLKGKPKKNEEDCFVQLWSDKEVVFFERANKELIEKGYIIEWDKPVEPEEKEKDYSEYTEERLVELVNAPFLKFKHELNEIDSEAVMYRLLETAQEEERPVKTIEHIEQRITELQQEELEG